LRVSCAGNKERGTFRVGVVRQRTVAARAEPRVMQPLLHLLAIEALPNVAKLDDVLDAVVRHEVDDEKSTVWLEHASDFAHHLRGISDEVRDEKQHRGVERVVINGQRFYSPS